MPQPCSTPHGDHGLPEDLRRDLTTRCRSLVAEHPPAHTPVAAFRGWQFDAGLAFVHFPPGRGGLGLGPEHQAFVDRWLRDAGAAPSSTLDLIGRGMAAPTIEAHGTDDQVHRFLRPLYTGEESWCQLFSEPGAGSDVAGVATRAVRDGDRWIVTGQKVWTSLAHQADWGMLVARTDPTVPKHRGLTFFVLDMRAPGVTVRPLYQMTGEAEFNEVFLDEVLVPDDHRIGEVGCGWSVVLTTLMNERVTVGEADGGTRLVDEVMTAWSSSGRSDPVTRHRVATAWMRAEILRLTNLRAAQLRNAGTPGAEGSVGKLLAAQSQQELSLLAVDLLGPHGMTYPGGYEMRRPSVAMGWRHPQQAMLRMRANSIEGGTSEIARNILGERVLHLPADVRIDRDRPWSDVPRS